MAAKIGHVVDSLTVEIFLTKRTTCIFYMMRVMYERTVDKIR